MTHHLGKQSWGHKVVFGVAMTACFSSATFAADVITGVVHDQTHGRVASGDEVILLRHDGSAKEEARAKTDSQGSFTLQLQDPGKPHLVRVIHQGVNYDRQVLAGGSVSIDVYDSAAKVQGITGGIEIIRVGTHGGLLHVSEMVEIKNESNPPVTLASNRTYEVYLPAQAKIDSVMAAGPENLGAMISAMPASGEAGRYTVNFPLRPGATKFAFNYDLPYDGRAVFRTRNMVPLQQLAVMIPPTMTFASRSPAFQILPLGNDRYHVEAAEQVKAGDGPGFEISGVGELPQMQAQQAQPQTPQRPLVGALAAPAPSATPSVASSIAPSDRSGSESKPPGAAPVSNPAAQPSRVQLWSLSATAALLLGACGSLAWRRHRRLSRTLAASEYLIGRGARKSVSLVEALKEGLFQLEADRLRGVISGEMYASTKRALNETIKWAIARTEVPGPGRPQQESASVKSARAAGSV